MHWYTCIKISTEYLKKSCRAVGCVGLAKQAAVDVKACKVQQSCKASTEQQSSVILMHWYTFKLLNTVARLKKSSRTVYMAVGLAKQAAVDVKVQQSFKASAKCDVTATTLCLASHVIMT